MNERILVEAIGNEIPVSSDINPGERKLRAGHYLEKICTDIYRLPLPKNPVKFFSEWVGVKAQKTALINALGDIQCLPPNPRRLKALANQWERFAECGGFPEEPGEEQNIWAVRVLIAAYIHQFHRDLWERWYFNPDIWNDFKAWCTGKIHYVDKDDSPKWAAGLELTEKSSVSGDNKASWTSDFPNPGDINIFWMDILVREYEDHLNPLDFSLLLHGKDKV